MRAGRAVQISRADDIRPYTIVQIYNITISVYRPHFHRQIPAYQSIQSYHTASAYARKVPADITVGTEAVL